jgi:peroxiredoxin
LAKIQTGQHIPDFTYNTSGASGLNFAGSAKGKKTVLVFLRYYGCPICYLDMRNLRDQYELVTKAGGQVFVVLQSKPETLGKDSEGFPFTVICDPMQVIYQQFEVAPASSRLRLIGARSLMKLSESKKLGIKYGEYEGDELQLPATFVTDEELIVKYVRYGTNAGDIPNPYELAGILKAI